MELEKDMYNLIDLYFKEHFYPFTKHHIDSYREFLRKYVPDVIKTYNPITMLKFMKHKENELELKVELFVGGKDGNNIYIDRPTILDDNGNPVILTPQEARLKNLTYNANIYADIVIRYEIAGKKEPIERFFQHILIGQVPLMVHSDGCILYRQGPQVLKAFDECIFDEGGYFIIDGKEKVIISQERMVTNRLFIEKSKDPRISYRGWIRSATEKGESSLLPKMIEILLWGPKPLDTDEVQEIGEEDEDEKIVSKNLSYNPNTITINIPGISGSIDMCVLFRALGVESDKSIIEHIIGDTNNIPEQYVDFLLSSINVSSKIEDFPYTQTEAIEQLKNKVKYQSNEHVHTILTNDVFPNMGIDYHSKARYLGYLIKQMMDMILGVIPQANRDNFGYKRIDLSGFLLSQLFNNIYKRFRKNCRDLLDQEYHYGPTRNTGNFEDMVRMNNIHKIISSNFITERLKRSLKGLWGSSDLDEAQEKVQDLSRISYLSFLSNLRRVNTPLDRSIKITGPHKLNAQQWGILCPFESPDGESIGYLKNMALLCQVSFGTDPYDLIEKDDNIIEDLDIIPLKLLTSVLSNTLTKVFINGEWIGCVENPGDFTNKFRLLRRNGLINIFISISWNIQLNEIRIYTDPGRGSRPLLIVKREKVLYLEKQKEVSWFDLIFGTLLPSSIRNESLYYRSEYQSPFKIPQLNKLKKEEVWKELEKTQGMIEYVDIEEEDTMMISMYQKDITAYTTHLEIHPSSILSVVTNNVPFANRNSAPRLIFYGAQSKQAIGTYATNFTKRFDTQGYVMHYSQKPLVTTKNSHYIKTDQIPAGYNTIVAIATYSGYNQEDAIIINKNSVDRGLFQLTSYKSYSSQEKSTNSYEYTTIANPLYLKEKEKVDIKNLKKESHYQLLDKEGSIIPESFIAKGSEQCVIGLVNVKEEVKEVRRGVRIETQTVKTYTDASIFTGIHHYGSIDKVYTEHSGENTDYNRVCKVRFRKVRRPEPGDKHCSRHGQKGVIGMILPEQDMPFTKDGIVPDIIINPHAIPSRMTVGHLVECVFAKVCSLEGTIGDGSVFIPLDFDKVGTELEKNNFEKQGNEILYNGMTGQQIPTEIFIGPTYYLRLKHMVADKIHSRDKGPKDQLTRQPKSGRSNEGGLRIGEMERDVLLSYGFSQFLKESMMERSDKFSWSVCKNCGVIAVYNANRNIAYCNKCNSQDIANVETPYNFKLLIQELQTMGLEPKIIVEDFEEEYDITQEDIMVGGDTVADIFNKPINIKAEITLKMEEDEENEENEENEVIDDIENDIENDMDDGMDDDMDNDMDNDMDSDMDSDMDDDMSDDMSDDNSLFEDNLDKDEYNEEEEKEEKKIVDELNKNYKGGDNNIILQDISMDSGDDNEEIYNSEKEYNIMNEKDDNKLDKSEIKVIEI